MVEGCGGGYQKVWCFSKWPINQGDRLLKSDIPFLGWSSPLEGTKNVHSTLSRAEEYYSSGKILMTCSVSANLRVLLVELRS